MITARNRLTKKLSESEASLRRWPYAVQILLFYLGSYALPVLIAPIALVFLWYNKEYQIGGPAFDSLDQMFLLGVVITPIAETFIFQHLVFVLLRKVKFLEANRRYIVIISAIFFGATHTYSLLYVLVAMVKGIALSYAYEFYSYNTRKAFWSTALVHAAHNFTSGSLQLLFGIG